MKLFLTLLQGLFLASLAAAEPQFSDVFTSGPEGFPSIRIPSVVVTHSGAVLAFAEGRKKSADQAENKIVLKRSLDGGATWGALQILADDGANSLNNPTAVVTDTGLLLLFYQRVPAHLKESSKLIETGYEGANVYRTFLLTSKDEGGTWSSPKDVTAGTKHPTVATTVASGPGIGIQLTRGPHRGRILIPFNEGPFWQWNNYAAYSDDAGDTWRCGQNVPGAFVPDAKRGQASKINEVQMVELSDGSVRLNSRQFAGAKVRKTSVSHDGGETWSPVEDVPSLRDPSCMASIFRYSFGKDGQAGDILYSGPDSAQRRNGVLHLSRDDGATWPVQRVLYPGSFAYSILTQLPDGSIGCLFEADNYKRIVFARLPFSWLFESPESSSPPSPKNP